MAHPVHLWLNRSATVAHVLARATGNLKKFSWLRSLSRETVPLRSPKSLLRIHLPLEHEIEVIKAVVLPKDGPIIGEFVFNGIGRPAVFANVLTGANGKAAGVGAQAKIGEDAAAEKEREAL